MSNNRQFWLKTIPYSLIDAVNRVALATGSYRAALAGGSADYNGHAVFVRFNSYRQYWTAEYTWAGRVVLARGSLANCLTAAKCEYNRGAKGCQVICTVTSDEDVAIAVAAGFEPFGSDIEKAYLATWKDARFDEVASAVRYEREIRVGAISYLLQSATVAEYNSKMNARFQNR